MKIMELCQRSMMFNRCIVVNYFTLNPLYSEETATKIYSNYTDESWQKMEK